ncbi:hypothetical protein [Nocardia crassostreae]|uniref:hypothetical protein n=1 Tax=Nocardia crassostreae TaxID=53428 RepID=UPI000A43082E|nr:hypothetical protein [Nocardia crassostreae]
MQPHPEDHARRDDRPDVVDKADAALTVGALAVEAPAVIELLLAGGRAVLRAAANLLN